jgi:O-methyltransferase
MTRITQLVDRVGGAALSNRGTVEASYQIARAAIESDVPGDFVECGVFAGVQAAMMAFAIMDSSFIGERRVHLFDTFTGIPAGGPEDTNWTHPAGTSACSMSQVMQNMLGWGIPGELLVFHPGLVEDTVPPFAAAAFSQNIRIAILRVDVDLYEPTKVVMDHLAPLVPRGGWIISDDFGLPGARKAVEPHLNSEVMYWRKTY